MQLLTALVGVLAVPIMVGGLTAGTAGGLAADEAAPASVAALASPSSSPWWRSYGPAVESVVPYPGTDGYLTAFDGAGVRGVAGAEGAETTPSGGGVVVANSVGEGYWQINGAGDVSAAAGAPAICGGSVRNCGYTGGTIVAAAAVPSGPAGAMWLLEAGGGVFATPGATSFGHVPTPTTGQSQSIVATPTGRGYYILNQDGGIHAFGDAVSWGDADDSNQKNWTGLALHLSAQGVVDGYAVIAQDGTLETYGAAQSYGYSVDVLDGDDGPVRAMTANHVSAGFVVMQQNGQLTQFPLSGAAPRTTNATVYPDVASKDNPAGFTFEVQVVNQSSRDLSVVPKTSANTNPAKDGTGFSSAAEQGLSALPVDTTVTLAAGGTSPMWPVTTWVYPSAQTRDTLLFLDVTPVADPSDRHRMQVLQTRDVIGQYLNDAEDVAAALQLLAGPSVSSVGSGTLTVSVEEPSPSSGSWEGAWRVVISDAPAPAVPSYDTPHNEPPTPVVTQLTIPYEGSNPTYEFLTNPIYRVDVPGFTMSWAGDVPGRVPAGGWRVVLQYGDGRPTEKLGTLQPVSIPAVDLAARTVTFGPSNFYHQTSSPVGWDGALLYLYGYGAFPELIAATPSTVVDLPSAPAGTVLSGLELMQTTQNVPAIPNNGVAAQRAQLSLQSNGVVIGAGDPLAWVYDRVFYRDADGVLITGLSPGESAESGYAAVSTAPALQTVDTQALAGLTASGADPTQVWVTSSEQAAAGRKVEPTLSIAVANTQGAGATAMTYLSTAGLAYDTYDPYGSAILGGSLTGGVSLGCATPSGVVACEPIYPTSTDAPTGTGAYYRDLAGGVQLLTEYHVLQAPTDASPPDTAALGMYDGALSPNSNQDAVLVAPPTGLPSTNPNPLLSVQLITPSGEMVDGTAHLTPTSTSEPPPGAFARDDPPRDAWVGTAYSYVFAVDGVSGRVRYELESGMLPSGLTLNAETGELSGTPDREAAFRFVVRAISSVDGAVVAVGGEHTIAVRASRAEAPDAGAPGDSRTGADRSDGELAQTGAEFSMWLVLCAVLMLLGGAALARRRVGDRKHRVREGAR